MSVANANVNVNGSAHTHTHAHAHTHTHHHEPPARASSEGPGTSIAAPSSARVDLTFPSLSAASPTRGEASNSSMAHGGNALGARPPDSSVMGGGPLVVSSPTGGPGYGALSLAPQRKKRNNGGTTMTLYVRPRDSGGSDGPSHEGGESAASGRRAVGGPRNSGGGGGGGGRGSGACASGGDAEERGALVVVENAISSLASASGEVVGKLPGLAHSLTHAVTMAGALFAFFLLVDVQMLNSARWSVETLLGATTAVNDQLLSMSTSLAEQHAVKRAYADALADLRHHAPTAAIARAAAEAIELADAKNRSIFDLRRHMGYPGPVEDLVFLVDQHVAYEMRLQKLAEEELAWARVASNSFRARAMANRRARVAIGPDGGAQLPSLSAELWKWREYATYPMRDGAAEEREGEEGAEGVRDVSPSDGAPLAALDKADIDAGAAREAPQTAAQASPRRRCRPRGTRPTPVVDGKERKEGREARQGPRGEDFDAFLETTQPGRRGRPHGRDEVSISASDWERAEAVSHQSIARRLLGNRLFAFVAICALMLLFFRV